MMKKFVKSKLKWVALFGVVLSAVSLFSHFVLAVYTGKSVSEYQTSITIFSWRPIYENAGYLKTAASSRRLWGPVRPLQYLHPHANPRRNYESPALKANGFIFVRIQGGFHDIRNSICDAVVVSRLLNGTLIVPELQSTTSSKGISSDFKSFAYLFNEDQFTAALAKDVVIERSLPRNLNAARRKKEIPVFRVLRSTSTDFYLQMVLPVLKRHSVVELLISDGGCLQAVLPPHLEEYQRLRCRVAFHALQFRQEVQELATKILNRLRASGRPFLAYDPGMTKDALAYHGCAELFQDVHAELIQHRRLWMIKHEIARGNLRVDSVKQHLNGSCPLLPEEVGILLRAYGYPSDSIIYVSGGEVFGGQRVLLPLHALFENVVDRTSLCTNSELTSIYGRERCWAEPPPRVKLEFTKEMKVDTWKTSGPRPRPLPPPPARLKYPYNLEGWWGWVAEVDKEPEPTIMELRTNAHKLLWEAIDYIISVEADVFIPGFDRDGKGHPNLATMVMGHRLYQSAASKTFRPDRQVVAGILEEIREHLYEANRTWVTSIRKILSQSLLDGLDQALKNSKPLSFLSHPVPECSCMKHEVIEASTHATNSSTHFKALDLLGVQYLCPSWMDNDTVSVLDKESEEDSDDDDSTLGQLFQQTGGGREVATPEMSNKEDISLEDQEELEGTER
ncbi:O-fucosyltransferase 27-like [Aristolochia californica]|uniref:O-fucosyltransferase 27-like n=1 Tax=Aristolochia californica TaxID=171875 RepID=UPI0035D7BE60